MTHRLWGCRNWQPLFAGLNLAPPVGVGLEDTPSYIGFVYLVKNAYFSNSHLHHWLQVLPAKVGTSIRDSIRVRIPIDGGMKQEAAASVPKKQESDSTRDGAGPHR